MTEFAASQGLTNSLLAPIRVRAALMEMWDNLNREDLGLLELLQQGRLSPAYDGGRLSPHWEEPTHQFGRRVVERILST